MKKGLCMFYTESFFERSTNGKENAQYFDRIGNGASIISDCFPVIRITLGAYDSAFSLFVPLFEQLEQDFYFPFVSDRVEQKII